MTDKPSDIEEREVPVDNVTPPDLTLDNIKEQDPTLFEENPNESKSKNKTSKSRNSTKDNKTVDVLDDTSVPVKRKRIPKPEIIYSESHKINKNIFKSLKEISTLKGVDEKTIRKWANDNPFYVRHSKDAGIYYSIHICPRDKQKRKICYLRFISEMQFNRESENMIEYFKKEYDDHEILTEIGSQNDYKREVYTEIMDHICAGNIESLVVPYSNTLCNIMHFPPIKVLLKRKCNIELDVVIAESDEYASNIHKLTNELSYFSNLTTIPYVKNRWNNY